MAHRLTDPHERTRPVPRLALAGACLVAGALLGVTYRPGIDSPPTSSTYQHVAHPARDPGCEEDQAAVVAPIPGPGLVWHCVNLEDIEP